MTHLDALDRGEVPDLGLESYGSIMEAFEHSIIGRERKHNVLVPLLAIHT